jgi:hypothetical protein
MRSSKKSSAQQKRAHRPRASQRRPVLAARVPEGFRAQILAAAAKSGRNASEELMWLAEQGIVLSAALEDAGAIREKAYSEANAVLAAGHRLASEELEVELQRRGYTYVRGTNGGAWFDPGVNAVQWIFDNFNLTSVEELLERAATRALRKQKETRS